MIADETARITASYVYRYADEIVVELTGEDGDGDIVVRSYQFETDGDDGCRAKTDVEPGYEGHVADALEGEGFEWRRD